MANQQGQGSNRQPQRQQGQQGQQNRQQSQDKGGKTQQDRMGHGAQTNRNPSR